MRRGRALRKRYGRSTGGAYAIEQSGGLFVVKLTRPLEVGSAGRSVPAGTTLGTINERGTISVWRSSGSVPRGYSEAARSMLDAARSDLKREGRIMAKQRAREAAEEQVSGSFIVKVEGGPEFRAHDFARARSRVESELLTRPIGTKARFYRASAGGGERTGIPWTEPFHVEEVYEWNGMKRVKGSS
jgi:hypothetical protein